MTMDSDDRNDHLFCFYAIDWLACFFHFSAKSFNHLHFPTQTFWFIWMTIRFTTTTIREIRPLWVCFDYLDTSSAFLFYPRSAASEWPLVGFGKGNLV